VGIPTQALALALYSAQVGKLKLKSVLLSTDYVPWALQQQLERIWCCKVFNHYGMTEMGLGGGVECAALSGYHLRETDLYFEIIDPVSGNPAPMGELGQVVFSTLTRVGMPLIRYATGDIARFIPERCACGSILRRMDTIQGRMDNIVQLEDDLKLALWDLDERLFGLPGVVNFTANVTGTGTDNYLNITLHLTPNSHITHQDAYNVLLEIPALNRAVQQGVLQVTPTMIAQNGEITGSAKRILQDLRVGRKANDKDQ
jgi:phenylacetate-coenzyme A ligase PaaK-like adenylate-forming protein